MELVKKHSQFNWREKQEKVFITFIEILIHELILALSNFVKSFEVECDASGVRIGVILVQEGHLITYFSEKLYGVALNYPIYDK